MHVINRETHKKRSRRQYACMRAQQTRELSRTLRFESQVTLAQPTLCLDWRIGDDSVGRETLDKPLLVSKSAKCGVKMQLCGVFRLRFVSRTNCFRGRVLLAEICHTCYVQQKMDQLTLGTLPHVTTPGNDLIADRQNTCMCTSAESYHRT